MKLHQYIKQEYTKDFKETDFPFEVTTKKVKKGTIITPYNKVEDKLYFLNEGIVETTTALHDIEKTLTFYFPNTFFTAFSSVMKREPSNVQSTTITDVIFEVFSFQAYQRACKTSLLINIIGRTELEKYFMVKNQREIDFLTKTSEEMYLDLIHKKPEILQHIPLKKIANYFGILPETLSRIRKRIIT